MRVKTLVLFGSARKKGTAKAMLDILMDAIDNNTSAALVYFNSITGKIKILFDRFQMFRAANSQQNKPGKSKEKGAELVMKGLFEDFCPENLGIFTFSNSDNRKVEDDEKTIASIRNLAAIF